MKHHPKSIGCTLLACLILGSAAAAQGNLVLLTEPVVHPLPDFNTKLGQYLVERLQVLDPNTNTVYQVLPGPQLRASLVASGAGGLDQGSREQYKSYSLFLIGGPSVAPSLIYSLNRSAPVLPAGYAVSCRISEVRTDKNGDIVPFLQQGRRCMLLAKYLIPSSGGNRIIDVDGDGLLLGGFMPSAGVNRIAFLTCYTNASAGGGEIWEFHHGDFPSPEYSYVRVQTGTGDGEENSAAFPIHVNSNGQCTATATAQATDSLQVYGLGFWLNLDN